MLSLHCCQYSTDRDSAVNRGRAVRVRRATPAATPASNGTTPLLHGACQTEPICRRNSPLNGAAGFRGNFGIGNKRVQYLVLAIEEFTAEGLDVEVNG